MPDDKSEMLRAILQVLEDEKMSGRVDTQVSNDIGLLISVTRQQFSAVSTEAIKENVRTEVNTIMAVRLITRPQ